MPQIVLLFLWLPNADYAVERVLERVSRGGHNIPEAVIRRRYATGLSNFFQMYRPLADTWRFMDNSSSVRPVVIATGRTIVREKELWEQIVRQTASNR